MTDNDIKKALECCITADSIADCMRLKCPMYTRYGCTYYLKTDDDNEHTICREQFKSALDLLNRLEKENNDLFLELEGVMWSVDKWLDGDELKQDKVNRAITMREKTLQITEKQQAEIERLKDSIKEANEYLSEGDFAKGIACIINLVKEMTEVQE